MRPADARLDEVETGSCVLRQASRSPQGRRFIRLKWLHPEQPRKLREEHFPGPLPAAASHPMPMWLFASQRAPVSTIGPVSFPDEGSASDCGFRRIGLEYASS